MMNKKGTTILVGIMLGILIIITALAFTPALKEQISNYRTSLGCSNDNLSVGETGTCILVDWLFPGFIGMCFMVGLSYLVAKRLIVGNSGDQ